MSSEPTDIEPIASGDSAPSTQADSQAQLVSVLSAMQASMTQTNEYLKVLFEERQNAQKRPLIFSEAEHSEEAGNDEHPAPKRAKSATKSGHNSDSTVCSTNQQSTDTIVDLVDIPNDVQETDVMAPDDTLSLFGGPEFDDNDDETDNDNLLSYIAQELCSKEQTGPPVSDQLAKIINSKLHEDLDVPKLKEILTKYKRPENCTEMYVPKVNTEIWQKMKPFAKKADIKMANCQDTIIKGLSCLTECINSLLQCRESKTIPNYRTLIPNMLDSTAPNVTP